jgi:hypothetical protein
MLRPVGLPEHMQIIAMGLSCMYTSPVTMRIPMQDSVFPYDTYDKTVNLVNFIECKLKQQTPHLICLVKQLGFILVDT